MCAPHPAYQIRCQGLPSWKPSRAFTLAQILRKSNPQSAPPNRDLVWAGPLQTGPQSPGLAPTPHQPAASPPNHSAEISPRTEEPSSNPHHAYPHIIHNHGIPKTQAKGTTAQKALQSQSQTPEKQRSKQALCPDSSADCPPTRAAGRRCLAANSRCLQTSSFADLSLVGFTVQLGKPRTHTQPNSKV